MFSYFSGYYRLSEVVFVQSIGDVLSNPLSVQSLNVLYDNYYLISVGARIILLASGRVFSLDARFRFTQLIDSQPV